MIKKDQFVLQKTSDIFWDYEFEDKNAIGQGTFGRVFKAKEISSGDIRAIKQIPKANIVDQEQFFNEINSLKQLDHPNVVKLIEIYDCDENIFLVMEYCSGGELFDKIFDDGAFNEIKACELFKQMVEAVNYCHANRICHRDLKPENFIFSDPGPDATLKLIDFGLSKQFYRLAEGHA